MKPKALSEENWLKLKRKFKTLTIDNWNYLDGVKKLALIRHAKVILKENIFGDNYILKYPDDIYMFPLTKRFVLNFSTVNQIRSEVFRNINEIGGTINYNKENQEKVHIKFSGDEKNIILDLKTKTHTLFHTHPYDEDRTFDPPSILDIISYLALVVKHVVNTILKIEEEIDKGVEKLSEDNILTVQNSMVFTHNEIYSYYISTDLYEDIIKKLMELYMNSKNFIYEVEKLLEEIEISYSTILYKYNYDLNSEELSEYLSTLSSLGFIIKRFTYNMEHEVHISL